MNKYRIHILVKGGISRPPYEGHVDVNERSTEEAIYSAKKKLRNTSFPDVGFYDMKVIKVEILDFS